MNTLKRLFFLYLPVGLLLTLLMGISPLAAEALNTSARPQLSAQLLPAPGETGVDVFIAVDFVIPQDMHQYRQDEYFFVKLAVDEPGIKALPVRYPAPTETVAGTPSWSGTVRLLLPLVFDESTIQNTHPRVVPVEAHWQICYNDGICLRPQSETLAVSVDALAIKGGSGGGASVGSQIWWYLLLAFLGGIILNFMPCVLPVLSLKLLGLVKNAGESTGRRVGQALSGAAGIVVSMMVLAIVVIIIQASGHSAGWGFQFQSPWYTMGLILVVSSFALSLFGVWILSAPAIQTDTRFASGAGRGGTATRKGFGAAFASGALTVVLATPCTAPFLGTALGFAFAAPWWVIMLSFLAISLGLALPFLILAVVPGLVRILPKPGAWMDALSVVMGFALLGTAVWLFSVLMAQLSRPGFVSFLWFFFFCLFGLWIAGQIQKSGLRPFSRIVSWILLALAFATSCFFFVPGIRDGIGVSGARGATSASGSGDSSASAFQSSLPPGWKVFDEAAIASDKAAGKTIFVDFTAEWCVTCKVNEAGVLEDSAVRSAFDAAGISRYRADYTNGDPVIDRWLRAHGRAGVPFYLLERPGRDPIVFPELLTKSMLIEAISSAGTAP